MSATEARKNFSIEENDFRAADLNRDEKVILGELIVAYIDFTLAEVDRDANGSIDRDEFAAIQN